MAVAAALFFSGTDLYSQQDEGVPPAEKGKVKKERPKANRGNMVERMKKRLEKISPDIPPVLDEVKDADPRLVRRQIFQFIRQTKTLNELKKTDETAFNRKVQIFILKLKAIPLVQEVKQAPDEQAKENAKKKLIEHLKQLMELEKAELEAKIKELQAKLDEYRNNPAEALKNQADDMTKEKERRRPRKAGKPKKKREGKKKDGNDGDQGDDDNKADAQLF